MLSRNIDRITAEQDIRQAKIALQAQSGEGFQSLVEDLQRQVGRVVEYDEAAKAMAATRDVITEEDKSWLNAIGDMSNVGSR